MPTDDVSDPQPVAPAPERGPGVLRLLLIGFAASLASSLLVHALYRPKEQGSVEGDEP